MLLLGLLVLGLSWLVPGHYPPWLSFQQEVVAAAGALLIGAAAVGAARGESRAVPWPPLALAVLATAAVPALQGLAGQVRFASGAVLATTYLCGFALTMVAGATLVRRRRDELIGGLFLALLAAGIMACGMALAQWAEFGPVPYVGDMAPGARPHANFGQPNHLATLLALALIGLLWLFETRRIGAAVAALGAAWLGIGLVSTQSRTGWVVMLALAAGVLLLRRRANLRTTRAAAVLAVALFVVLVLAWQPIGHALLVTPSLDLELRALSSPRLLMWSALIDAVGASPWLGYGWTQVAMAAQTASLTHNTGLGQFVNGHNLLLDLLLWNGVPLGLLLIGVLLWWFGRQLWLCRDAERAAILAAVGAVFVHAMFEYPLEYAYFLLPTGLLMGALDELDEVAPALRTPAWSLALPLAALVAVVGWVAVEYLRVEESFRTVRFVMAGIGVDKVPTAPPPDVRLLDGPREYHRFWVTEASENMKPAQLDAMRRVLARHPTPPVQLRFALAAALNGHPGEARDTLTRLCHMHGPERCREGVESWQQLQRRFPPLGAVPFPANAAAVAVRSPG